MGLYFEKLGKINRKAFRKRKGLNASQVNNINNKLNTLDSTTGIKKNLKNKPKPSSKMQPKPSVKTKWPLKYRIGAGIAATGTALAGLRALYGYTHPKGAVDDFI